MIRREFLASLLLLVGCNEEDVKPVKVSKIQNAFQPPANQYPATTGETAFSFTDNTTPQGILGENLIYPLYLTWMVPAKGSLSLLVFLNGWNSGGNYLPTAAQQYLSDNNIAFVSIGKRGRNTIMPGYVNDNAHPGVVEQYRDASGAECYDIYQTIQYFLNNVVVTGQINTQKIFAYGSSGGGGNAIAMASKYPELFSIIVDWFGMSKYGSYPGDPGIAFLGWAVTNTGYTGAIQDSIGGPSVGSIGYTAGVNDAFYPARDHIRGVGNYKGKIYMYHYTGDTDVSVVHSDNLETQLIANGQTYIYHRSASIYTHGNFDLLNSIFDSVTPYGLHWVSDAKTLTAQTLPNSGTLFVAGFVVTSNFQVWCKRYIKNVVDPNIKYNQGRIGATALTYNVSANTYTMTPVFPTSPTEPYMFVYVVVGSIGMNYLVADGDTIAVSPKTLAKKPASLNYTWTLFYDLSDSDGYVLDDAGNVSNIIDLTGNNRPAWQQTRATRKAITSGGLSTPIYLLRGTSGTLASNVDSFTLTGTFSLVVKVNATTVGTDFNILGRGTSSLYIGPFGPYTHTQIVLKINGSTYQGQNNSTNTEAGTGLMVIGLRRDSSNNIYMYSKSAAGLFVYGPAGVLGNNSSAFDVGSIGGVAAVNQFNGTIYRVATSSDDIGATDMQTLLNSWYAS